MSALDDAFFTRPIAHRALHDVNDGRPENSVEAIEAAIAAGYGIEIDLQLSRDGCAMVFHDYDMGRLTGENGPIQQQDADALGETVLLGGESGVPSFTEVLRQVAGRVPMLVELKDQHGQMGVTDGRLERAVAAAIEGYKSPLALMSFNPNSVAELARLAPDVPRGIVTCHYPATDWPTLRESTRSHLRAIPDYDRTGSCFISHQLIDLDAPRVAELKKAGSHVFCWTVRSPRQEADARQVAENITFEGYLPPFPA